MEQSYLADMKLKKVSRSCVRINRDEEQIDRCKDLLSGLNADFSSLSKVVQLAGNEVRMKILWLIYHEESLCVCDLSDVLEMKIPAVSQHLRKLKDAGLLASRREGTVIFYNITPDYHDTVQSILQLMSRAQMIKAV